MFFKNVKVLETTLFSCLVLAGCAVTDPSSDTDREIPVRWSTGYTMAGLLAQEDISVDSISDLSRLLTDSWYADIDVDKTNSGVTTLSSCAAYFDEANRLTRTTRDYEMGAYLELKVMCEATKILIEAGVSKESFLSDDLLNAELPKLLPKQVAMQISTEEAITASLDPVLKTWNDARPVTRYESLSETKAAYFHEGGYQEVEIVGYGDVNNDGVEDLVVVVSDYAEGGSYFNLRLFVLSVTRQGNWILIHSI